MKLYWQVNCKRAWLTLEKTSGERVVIDSIPFDLAGYQFRLGHHLMKEYKDSLFFRGGCPATGECIYSLLNKSTGRLIKRFSGVIRDDAEKYDLDFIVYVSGSSQLTVYSIYTGREIRVPIRQKLTMVYPEWHFSDVKVMGNLLTLKYQNDNRFINRAGVDRGEIQISVDLKPLKAKRVMKRKR